VDSTRWRVRSRPGPWLIDASPTERSVAANSFSSRLAVKPAADWTSFRAELAENRHIVGERCHGWPTRSVALERGTRRKTLCMRLLAA
jgi:hypothetical protein